MAHLEQRDFLSRVKKLFPENFFSVKVLDIGSFNVNGTERDFFSNADITGLDIAEGECVDVVCPAQDYDAPNDSFDTIISCECWEHNPYYKESILNALRMLKSEGLFVFTLTAKLLLFTVIPFIIFCVMLIELISVAPIVFTALGSQ